MVDGPAAVADVLAYVHAAIDGAAAAAAAGGGALPRLALPLGPEHDVVLSLLRETEVALTGTASADGDGDGKELVP
eukprot:66008-Chlamydomonas_euryale.AAC.1